MPPPDSPLKTRLLWIAIIALALPALYFGIARPHVSSIPKHVSEPMEEMKPPMPPPIEMPALEIPPIPTVEPPVLKPVPLIEPDLKPSGGAKPGSAGDKK